MALPDPQLDLVQAAGLSFLTDNRLFDECGIRIAFTNRSGGVSEGQYASLNLGSNTYDDPANADANRGILAKTLDISKESLICPKQVHGDEIVVITNEDDAFEASKVASLGADGIIVSCANVAPLLCFADCVPVIIVAPHAFAVVHAGWRGVMAKIAPKAVRMISEMFPEDDASSMNVYIGPHIGPECFETSVELHDLFVQEFGGHVSASFRHVDLSAALIASLVETGVSASRIIDSGICTSCDVEQYFSYRAQDGDCGRHGAICFRKE